MFSFRSGKYQLPTLAPVPCHISDASITSPAEIATPCVIVKMYNLNTTSISNTLFLKLTITNNGLAPINLSDLKIRYYYTVNGEQPQNLYCDFASVGDNNITSNFVKLSTPETDADYYVEIGFEAAAGILQAGASTKIVARIAKSDWSNYIQDDDYSFNPTASTYFEWNKCTAYISGTLQYGIAP